MKGWPEAAGQTRGAAPGMGADGERRKDAMANADRSPGRGHLGRTGWPISFRGPADLEPAGRPDTAPSPHGSVRTSGLIAMCGTRFYSAGLRLGLQTIAVVQLWPGASLVGGNRAFPSSIEPQTSIKHALDLSVHVVIPCRAEVTDP